MLKQTPQERISNSVEIERLLQNELKTTIESIYNRNSMVFNHKLGMTKDDILNDMRMQVWKGLLTFKPELKIKLSTYLDNIIKNRFNTFRRRASLKKYNSLDYFKTLISHDGVDQEHFITEETGETILERRQELMKDLVSLTEKETKVMADLMVGFTLHEMARRNSITTNELVGIINKIDTTIRKRREIA